MSRVPGRLFARPTLGVVGVLAGAATAIAELGLLVLIGLLLLFTALVPAGRRAVRRHASTAATWVTRVECRRLRRFHGGVEEIGTAHGARAAAYLATRWLVGLLGGVVLLLFVFGAVSAAQVLRAWLTVGDAPGFGPGTPSVVAYFLVFGLVLLFLDLSGIAGVIALDGALARRLLVPSAREALQQRVSELTTSRAEVVDAVNSERRRIERDLHDGVQQRLVALAMLLGRARRQGTEDRADLLLAQAHEESQRVLTELQDVAWRVYPAALDDLGLRETLSSIAERSAVPVRVDYRLGHRPSPVVQAVAYFVASEGITNAVKHAHASLVTVEVGAEGNVLVMRVRDDGRGGADRGGGGLSGLAKRVAALDGRFEVDSPTGGPTTVTAELPCG